jgi:hypothetical protein
MQAHAQDPCEYIDKRSTPKLELLDQWRTCEPVPYVGPDGEFEIRFVDLRTRNGEFKSQLDGLTPVHFENGTISIARWARAVGFVLYEDICKGRAESVIDGEVRQIEASPKHWQAWLNYVALMRRGAQLPTARPVESAEGGKPVVDSITSKMYHPEVIRRREQAKRGGRNTISEERALEMILATPEDMLEAAGRGASDIVDRQRSVAEMLDAEAQPDRPTRKRG